MSSKKTMRISFYSWTPELLPKVPSDSLVKFPKQNSSFNPSQSEFV
jgi:hypothetical protein